jgi:hypothetical protein
MIERISQFTLLINKVDKSHSIWIKDEEWKELEIIDFNITYLIGHKVNKTIGEFICIDLGGDSINIYNDLFGSIPIYIYETETHIGITNSLSKLNHIVSITTDIEERQFYEYFIFGYQTCDNQSFYKYIKTIQTEFKFSYSLSTKKISTQIKKGSFYSNEINSILNNTEDISETLKIETKVGIESLDGSSAILLSGGKDSLLGGLLVKSVDFNKILTTATFGLQNSQDVVLAKLRSMNILNSVHYEYLIDQMKINQEDFINHSVAQNGFGTLSSIYYSFFLKHLKGLDITNAIFSDHFECTRKEIPDIAYLKERYTTPSNVVERYIRHQEIYYNYLNEAVNRIQQVYGQNACYKFYYHDRNQRGQAWKMVLCNEYGLIKYNLSNNIKFLKQNYHDVNFKHEFNYNKLIGSYSKDCGIKSLESEQKYTNLKDLPIDPKQLIYSHSEFFIKTLCSNVSLSLKNYFNLENIINDIEKRAIIQNGEWLILRLLNLTIFNNYLKVKQ